MLGRKTISIVAIAKDEDPYIIEWLAYHLAIGVDHIFVYDNGSRIPIASQLSALGSWRSVTVTRWEDRPGKDSQIEAYAHYLRRYGRKFEWTAAIDIDEFLCLPQDDSVKNFLDRFPNANGIIINWRYFGSSGHARHDPRPVTERFTLAAQIHSSINTGVKAIYRTADVERLFHHWSPLKVPRKVCSPNGGIVADDTHTILAIDDTNFAVAQLNHYFVKSRDEWQRKVRRGYSWCEEDRSSDRFAMCDLNDVEDVTILRSQQARERWTRRLKSPPPGAVRVVNRLFRTVLGWITIGTLRCPPAARSK